MSSLAADLACALDPVALAQRLGIVPDDWQARALRSASKQIILNCSRQAGKSLVSALLATHTSLYDAGAPIILLGPSERQAAELLRKVRGALRELGEDAPEFETDNTLSLELANGSRILALPGKDGSIRGYSAVKLLVIDEASRVPDELYHAVRPMLAVSGGRLVLLSTPFGRRGFFHQEWSQGYGWDKYEVPASANPRIAEEFLEGERRSLPRQMYRQEFECEFIDTSGGVFDPADLARMFGTHNAPADAGDDGLAAYEEIFG